MLLFETTWMDFEGTVLSEINQTKTNTVGCHLYAEPEKKKKKTLRETKNRLKITRGGW